MNTLQLAKLKQHLLKEIETINEIGEGTRPFPFEFVRKVPTDSAIADWKRKIRRLSYDADDDPEAQEQIDTYNRRLRTPKYYYRFETDQEDTYLVIIETYFDSETELTISPDAKRYLQISFEANDSYTLTDSNETLRVMSTIVAVTRVALDSIATPDDPIHGIMYNPIAKSGEEPNEYDPYQIPGQVSAKPITQRDRLYRVYITKAFQSQFGFTPEFKSLGAGNWIGVEFPKPWTGE